MAPLTYRKCTDIVDGLMSDLERHKGAYAVSFFGKSTEEVYLTALKDFLQRLLKEYDK
jgi:thiamine monophosphate kinase